MGMKRSWRAARRVALRRSGDSSRHPADTIACTATAEAGARILPAAPAAPPPSLAPRSPHSPSPLPAKVSGPMGPSWPQSILQGSSGLFCPALPSLLPSFSLSPQPLTFIPRIPSVSVLCPRWLFPIAFISTTHFHPCPLVFSFLAAFLSPVHPLLTFQEPLWPWNF